MNTITVIEIPQEKALDIFTAPQGLEPYLKQITAQVESFVGDISTRKGREEIASMAHRVARSKTALDSVGKELVAKLKQQPKLVDAERKRSRDYLDALRDRVRLPLTDWEQADQSRIDAHKDALYKLSELAVVETEIPANEIGRLLAKAEAFAVSEEMEEFEAEAAIVKLDTVTKLKSLFDSRVKYETEQVELARFRKEQSERAQKEHEERIALEAAELARAQAEAKAATEREAAERRERELKAESERKDLELKLAAEREERLKRESAEREKQAVIDAHDRAKREAEEKADAEQAEQEKREANKRYAKRINNEAAVGFSKGGFSREQAIEIVSMIALGKIKHVSISY